MNSRSRRGKGPKQGSIQGKKDGEEDVESENFKKRFDSSPFDNSINVHELANMLKDDRLIMGPNTKPQAKYWA